MWFFLCFKNKTDLFLQALTHGTVHFIARAEELHEIVLRQNKNSVHVASSVSMGYKDVHRDAGSNVPQCDTASVV